MNFMNKNCIDIIPKIRYENIQKEIYADRKIDERVKIEDPTVWPYKCIGTLLTFFNGNYWLGTGTLIGPRLVLTAAHNLFVLNEFKGVSSKFFIELNGNEYSDFAECSNITNINYCMMPEEYISGLDEDNDYALLVLDKPLGDIYGYFDLKVLDSNEFIHKDFYCFGYPGDKIVKEAKLESGEVSIIDKPHYQMWGMKVNPTLNNEMIEYLFDSYSGLSGSSIFYEHNGKAYVVGVHVMHNPDTRIGYGVHINSKRLSQIMKWIEQINI